VGPRATSSQEMDRPSRRERVQIGNWEADIDAQTGDITALTAPDGTQLAGQDGSLIGYRYESYDDADVKSHMASYLTHWQEWAILDHDKPGLGTGAWPCKDRAVRDLDAAVEWGRPFR
jgi:hypothetical protein